MQDLHVYIHWPFCKSLCPYCDFNSFVYAGEDRKSLLSSYLSEIKAYANEISSTHLVRTIFFGGGTPSLMEASEVSDIINCVIKNFKISENLEITLEANPTSFEIAKFLDFSKAGINRVSIGVQSFSPENLKILGREHSKDEAEFAIKSASEIFKNVSFDLMFGVPGQDIKSWSDELLYAMKNFTMNHISIYNLTIEKGTEFFSMHKKNQLILPQSSELEDMYEKTTEIAAGFGLLQYEVSNYAKKSYESKHNLGYWKIKDYIGIGPGAHGRVKIGDRRFETMNFHVPKKWDEACQKNGRGLQKFSEISKENQISEILLMGLRIRDGIDILDIKNRIGIDLLSELDRGSLGDLKKKNLLDFSDLFIKPTEEGVKFVNYISKCLLGIA